MFTILQKFFWEKKPSTILLESIAPEKNGFKQQRIFNPQTIVEKFRAMSPYDFEYAVKDLFEARWYTTIREPLYRTTRTGKKIPLADNGIDYIWKKNGQKHFVQVKTYKWKRQVTIWDLREFNSALQDAWKWKNDKAYFITTTIFTKEAESYAASKKITCIDFKGFEKLHNVAIGENDYYKNHFQEHLSRINFTDNARFTQHMKTCPWCGATLVTRRSRTSQTTFLWCQNFAKTWCKYREYIRKQETVGIA